MDAWMDGYLSALGTTELIPLCPCLMCAAFATLAKLSSSQPKSFHTFTLPPFLLILPEGVSQWLRGAVPPLQLTHKSIERTISVLFLLHTKYIHPLP